MLRVFNRSQTREFDRLASSLIGLPSSVLMENAGRGATQVIIEEARPGRGPEGLVAVVVCGAGNNAGDGYVVARRLALLGARVEVFATHAEDRLTGDAALNCRAWLGSAGTVRVVQDHELADFERALSGADVVVDALFGTGLTRPIDGLARELVTRINAARCRRVAIDLPSGIDADTGGVQGVAVRADATVTFAAHKLGLLTPTGRAYAGRIHIADIGVAPEALAQIGESAHLLESKDVRKLLLPRGVGTHKASAGRVLVLAGAPGKVGAALLVAEGALRAGAGLVTLAGVPAVASVFEQRVLEAMTARLDPERLEETLGPLLATTDVVAIGPGLGFDALAERIIRRVVLEHPGPVIVDADAISHFKHTPDALAESRGRLILTPHTGEMARLLGLTSAEVEAERLETLAHAVEKTRATVLLKGPHTMVGSPGKLPVIGSLGSTVLATGGAGDVLTGVVAALACELAPFEAAHVGAYIHAHAGQIWAREVGADRGLLAHEIAERVPRAMAAL